MKDGGPAFATYTTIRKVERESPSGPPGVQFVTLPDHMRFHEVIETTGGLSMRDYFAAAALPSLLGSHGQHWTGGHETPDMWIVLAERAYDVADAMLAEREKP